MGRRAVDEFETVIRRYDLTWESATKDFQKARNECGLKRKKRAKCEPDIPTVDEVRTLLAHVERESMEEKMMVRLMLYMALRVSEVRKIRIDDIDFEHGRERIYARRKGGKNLHFAIPKILCDSLRLYVETIRDKNTYLFDSPSGGMYEESTIRKRFSQYRKKTGLPARVHPHGLRGFSLTFLAGKHWNIFQIQQVSGHSSATSLNYYMGANTETIRDALNQTMTELFQMVG